MAKFNLTAQLNIQAPTNLQSVVNQINSQLKGVNVDLNINLSQAGTAELNKLNQTISGVSKSASSAKDEMFKFGQASAESIKRFAGISVASSIFYRLVGSIRSSVKEAIDFQDEMVKISQVTGLSLNNLGGLEKQVTSLATSLGVSSRKLIDVAQILAQAGLSAKDTEIALATLAKTELAATFTDIKNTTEGAVAAMAQFGRGAESLDEIMGSINEVSAKFAVEASDLVTVIRRAGGAFKTAGGDLNELLALFTSVRSTTRESAESISTGFRTIFTRIQRNRTIDFLKELGIELRDVEGKFVGPYQAVERLSAALSQLEGTDPRVNAIIEELGGFRQVEKVIPLLQQFGKAQQALTVAQMGSASLTEDAATRQQSYAIQIQKLNEEFQALIRTIANNSEVKAFAQLMLSLATEAVKLTKALEPLIPLIGAFAAYKVGTALGPFAKGFAQNIKFNTGGKVPRKFADGGFVPGHGDGDTVPAMLTPGEFVIRKSSVNKIGVDRLHAMNRKYAGGGYIEDRIPALLTPGEYVFGKSAAQRIGYGNLRRMNVAGYEDGDVVKRRALRMEPQKPGQKIPFEIYEDNPQITGTNVATNISSNRASEIKRAEGAKWIINQPFSALVPGDDRLRNVGYRSVPSVAIGEAIKKGAKASDFGGDTKGQIATPNFKIYGTTSKAPEILGDRILNGAVDYVNKIRRELNLTQTLSGPEQLFDASALGSMRGAMFEAFLRGVAGDFSESGKVSPDFDFPQKSEILKTMFGDYAAPADAKNVKDQGELKGSMVKKAIAFGFTPQKIGSGETSKIQKRAAGGIIPGFGNGDTVPAMLTPGEYVVRKQAVEAFGVGNLNKINRFASGGLVQQFKAGDKVQTGGGFLSSGGGAALVTVLPTLIFQMQATGTQFEGISKTLSSTILQFTTFKAVLNSATETARENKRVKAEELRESIKVKKANVAKISPDVYTESGRLKLGEVRPGYQEEIAAARASITKDQARLSKLERASSGRVATGLNIAGNVGLLATSFATTYGEERKQKAMSRLQEGDTGAVGEYTTGAAIAGFGSRIGTGAVLGASLGSAIPVVGTAIGAAVGAIGGATLAFFEMEKATQEAAGALQQFAASKTITSLQNKFQALAETPTLIGGTRAGISAQLTDLRGQFLQTAPGSEARQGIKAGIKGQLTEVDNFIKLIAQSSSNMEEFKNASKEAVDFLADFSNLSIDEINKKYLNQIGLMEKESRTRSALSQAEAFAFVRMQNLSNTLAAFEDAVTDSSTALSSFFGRGSLREDKLRQGIGFVTAATGTNPGINEIANDIFTASNVRKFASGILLQSVANQPLGADEDTIVDSILKGFSQTGFSRTALSAIEKRLIELKGPTRNENLLRQEIIREPGAVVGKLLQDITEYEKQFGGLLKIIESQSDKFNALLDKRNEAETRYTESLRNLINIQEQAARFEARVQANRTGVNAPQDFGAFSEARQRVAFTAASNITGRNYQGLVNNPEAIGNELQLIRQQQFQASQQRTSVGISPDQQKNIDEWNKRLEGAANRLIETLVELRDANGRAADAINNYEMAVSKRKMTEEAIKDIGLQVATGGRSEAVKIRQAETAFQKFRAGGIGALGGAGSQETNLLISFLKQLPRQFETTIGPVEQVLEQISQQALLEQAPNIGQVLRIQQPRTEEEAAADKVREAYQTAAQAAAALATEAQNQTNILVDALNKNSNFQEQLNTSLQESIELQRRQTEASAAAKQLEREMKQASINAFAGVANQAYTGAKLSKQADMPKLAQLYSESGAILDLAKRSQRIETSVDAATGIKNLLSSIQVTNKGAQGAPTYSFGDKNLGLSLSEQEAREIINQFTKINPLLQEQLRLTNLNIGFTQTRKGTLELDTAQFFDKITRAIGEFNKSINADKIKLGDDIQTLGSKLSEPPEFVEQFLSKQISKALEETVQQLQQQNVTFKASGGLITKPTYLAYGGSANFKSVGTDTVPAMLTPGEFVINKSAAQNIGYGNLERMNAQKFNDGGKVQKFQAGGRVADAAVSRIEVNPDFMSSVRLFNTAVDKLTEAFKVFPHEISMSVSHRVEVIHNGAQVFSQMQSSIQNMIGMTVNNAINKMISEKFPNVGPFQGAGNELGNSG